MRKIIARTVAATFFALLIMSACNRDTSSFEPVPSNSRAVLRLSGLGDCEQPAGPALTSGRDDKLLVVVESGKVSFTHTNALFNCCKDSLSLNMAVKGTVVRVAEIEHCTAPCKCICGFTVYGEIIDLEPGWYTLEICPDITGEQVLCSVAFTVD